MRNREKQGEKKIERSDRVHEANRESDGVRGEKRVRSHHVNSLKHRIEMEEAVAMAAEAASFC